MIDKGVVDEVKKVLEKVVLPIENKAAFRAIGVSEIKQFIDNHIDFSHLERLITTKTRQYAKRQRTWFRNKFRSWNIVGLEPKKTFKEISQDIESISKI